MNSWRHALHSLAPRLLPRAVILSVFVCAFMLLIAPTSAFAAPAPFVPWWVQNFQQTPLWSGPTPPALDYGTIPQWSYFLVVAPQRGPRLFVYVPSTGNYAYVNASSVGPSGAPLEVARSSGSSDWVGTVSAKSLEERSAPSTSAPIVKTTSTGTTVHVAAWVSGTEAGKDDWTWAKLADGNYAFGESLRVLPPTEVPPPPANHPPGKWIYVNLTRQIAVAYEGDLPVHLAVVSTGRPGWETPLGPHRIVRRVGRDTLLGSTLRTIGLDSAHLSEASYDYQNVHDVQYFDYVGDALHEAYWLPPSEFGVPHTHGCVGMPLADAQWFWNWAGYGVPVVVTPK